MPRPASRQQLPRVSEATPSPVSSKSSHTELPKSGIVEAFKAARVSSSPEMDQVRKMVEGPDASPEMKFQVAMMELQQKMALEQLLLTTVGNIEKKKDDTSAAIAQNVK